MVNLSREYINTPCQIYTTNNVMIGVGKISVVEDNYMIISNEAESFPSLKFLSYAKIVLHSSIEGYKVILASVSDSQSSFIRLGNLNLLTDDQKRNYFRVNVNIESKVFVCNSSLNVEKQLSSTNSVEEKILIPSIDITIKDLSLGGALIESNSFLQIGQQLVIEVISNKKSQYLLMSIKRRRHNEDEVYEYGCKFLEKSNKKMDELCRLILETQSQMIKTVKQI